MHSSPRGNGRRLLGMAALVCALTACGGAGSSAQPTATSSTSGTVGPDVQVIGTDFAVGRNRFTFSLSENNRLLTSAKPTVYFFALHGFNAVPAGHGLARFEVVGSGDAPSTGDHTGIYVTNATFNTAGKWGAEIDLVTDGKKRSLQTIFQVSRRSSTPAVGQPAPRSHNPTLAQEAIGKLDSGHPPDDMHRVSIASAIAHHRPLLVLFASAAYCGTFHCNAEIATVRRLEGRYRAAVDFVHIDVFQNARPPHLAATATQWRISSQPWVFVVNRRGVISAKFEGPAAAGEIEPALQAAARP